MAANVGFVVDADADAEGMHTVSLRLSPEVKAGRYETRKRNKNLTACEAGSVAFFCFAYLPDTKKKLRLITHGRHCRWS
jgi:hypothetical protein